MEAPAALAPTLLLIEDNPGDAELVRLAKRAALITPAPRIVHHASATAVTLWPESDIYPRRRFQVLCFQRFREQMS